MEVKITKLNHSGEGMGKINEKIVFIPKTLPDDIIEITNIEDHKNYIKATCNNIIKKSDIRESIKCPYYKECGGCQLLGLPYQNQLEYKKEKVVNILKKYANLNINNITIKESPNEYNYRNKITFQVKNNTIGLFKYNTNDIIEIDSCLLISNKMNQIINLIKDNINIKEVTQIIIREALEKIMIQIIGNTSTSELIKTLSNKVDSIYLNDKHIYGQEYLIDELGEYQFQVSPKSFFQVNHLQTINLYNQIKTYLGKNNNNILDLYCGTGTIGIYVSDCCKKVTGIELNESSVKDANLNIERNKLNNIQIKKGDVAKVLTSKNDYDTIIVDPPRSGLDKKTRQILKQIKSPKIIYVSCDPITLARDLNDLKELYNLKEISLFDMFPNTYHVECVMWMSLKK